MLLALLLLVLLAAPAAAQLPTGCVFPGALDNFQAVAPGQRWTADLHNKMQCAINELEELSLDLNDRFSAGKCSNITVEAGERKQVTWQLASAPPVPDNWPVISVKDVTAPAGYVVPAGVESVVGAIVKGYIWNHDASNQRNVVACVEVGG